MRLLTYQLPGYFLGLHISFSEVMVVIAALNEEDGIGPTLRELRDVLVDPCFLVVDGNSADRTAEVAEELGAEVIFQRGKGKGSAIAQALQHVNADPSYILFTDADYTYPAQYIPEMIEVLMVNPDVGMIMGNRFDKEFEFKAMRDVFYLGNRFLAFAQHLLNGVKLCDPLTGLRVVRWDLLRHWRPKSKCFDVEAELNHYVEKSGYRIVEIPIQYRRRLGEKKLKLKHGFTIFKRILIGSFT
jgi:glycosyltransferase involved in cell wall biosynthesis